MEASSFAQRDLESVFHSLSGRSLARDFGDFETRLIFQKTMYLLCAARAVRPNHGFGLHLYGPYSPKWATAGFEVKSGKSRVIEVGNQFPLVSKLVKGKGTDELVALAVLHFYHRALGLSKDESRSRLINDGKDALLSYFDPTWAELESVHWLG